MSDLFVGSVQDKTQADGAQTISLDAGDRFREHQIQMIPSATPSAGTLTVAIKTPGAPAFNDVGTIDMTDATKYVMKFRGFASQIRFTPASFDGDKTFSIFVCSGAGK